jgi:hypothetical protein
MAYEAMFATDLRGLMKRGKADDYRMDEQGTVWLEERIGVPQDKALLEQIMREAHDLSVGDRPRGPHKQWGNPHLNPYIETR